MNTHDIAEYISMDWDSAYIGASVAMLIAACIWSMTTLCCLLTFERFKYRRKHEHMPLPDYDLSTKHKHKHKNKRKHKDRDKHNDKDNDNDTPMDSSMLQYGTEDTLDSQADQSALRTVN